MPKEEVRQLSGSSRAQLTRRRFVVLIGLGLAGLAAACTGGTDPKPRGGTPATADGSDTDEVVIEIDMGDIWFDGPQVKNGGKMGEASEITVPVNRTIRFRLKNVGQLIHNFHIFTEKQGESIAVSDPNVIRPGEEGELVVTFSEPGTLFYWCDFHPMSSFGDLEVTPT